MGCNPSLAERSLKEAVKLFQECKLPIREASCHEKLGDFETAAGEECGLPSLAGPCNKS